MLALIAISVLAHEDAVFLKKNVPKLEQLHVGRCYVLKQLLLHYNTMGRLTICLHPGSAEVDVFPAHCSRFFNNDGSS